MNIQETRAAERQAAVARRGAAADADVESSEADLGDVRVSLTAEVVLNYIDMRTAGKNYEEFYKRMQHEGIHQIRGKVAEITDQAETDAESGRLICLAEDTLLGERVRVPVDMVVLCSAMEARADAVEVGRIFGVNPGADGFFLEEHPKLGPLNTATDGVFLAGACQGPKDIPDTVAQASGAAVKALSLATRGVVEVPSAISWIDPEICSGCKTCIGLCAYSAIEFDDRRQVSVVNGALCKGCGLCAATCPKGGVHVHGFTLEQLQAQVDAALADETLLPGEAVQVRLSWAFEQPPADDLSRFVHLLGPDGAPITQFDSAITTRFAYWSEMLNLTLPASLPPGTYSLTLSLSNAGGGWIGLTTPDGAFDSGDLALLLG